MSYTESWTGWKEARLMGRKRHTYEQIIHTLQDELLAREVLDTLVEAKVLVARWRRHYNACR